MLRFLLFVAFFVVAEAVMPLSEQSRRIAIDMHNKFRSIVAQGSAKSRNVMPLPSAAKMRKVSYSIDLEHKAALVAGACDISIHTTGQPYVENYAVYSIKFANVSQETAMMEGVKKWYDELSQVGVNGVVFTRSTSFGVRHFTQMVSDNLEEIGCSVNFCGYIRGSALNGRFNTRALVVCMYRPKANKYGMSIYEAGNACSRCSEINGRCESQLSNEFDFKNSSATGSAREFRRNTSIYSSNKDHQDEYSYSEKERQDGWSFPKNISKYFPKF